MNFKEERWGDLTRHILTDPNTGAEVIAIPEMCGAIHTLILSSKDAPQILISEDTDPKRYKEGQVMYPSSKLSPFPSRLRNGIYHFNGVQYKLPLNDHSGKHAIHGLVAGLNAKFLGTGEYGNQLGYRLEYDGSPGYPFPFVLEITYVLTSTSLEVHSAYRNVGTGSMPIGDGWHHYFRLNGGIDQHHIRFYPKDRVVLDHDLLPTGKREVPDHAFAKAEKLEGLQLDDCFEVEEMGGIHETTLEKEGQKVCIWQETGNRKYKYLVLYTPGERDRIAVEPLTCGPDMLNTGIDLILLEPGELLELKMGIKLN